MGADGSETEGADGSETPEERRTKEHYRSARAGHSVTPPPPPPGFRRRSRSAAPSTREREPRTHPQHQQAAGRSSSTPWRVAAASGGIPLPVRAAHWRVAAAKASGQMKEPSHMPSPPGLRTRAAIVIKPRATPSSAQAAKPSLKKARPTKRESPTTRQPKEPPYPPSHWVANKDVAILDEKNSRSRSPYSPHRSLCRLRSRAAVADSPHRSRGRVPVADSPHRPAQLLRPKRQARSARSPPPLSKARPIVTP